ncbi:MAG: adenylate/guanylate cyclase domain-containing protein [Candidatus Rifleibacteriota bacterium]
MNKEQSTTFIKARKPAGYIPVALWIFCFVIPLLAGKHFMTKTIDFDRRLNLASVRQNLINEKQKYNTVLNSEDFLNSRLESRQLAALYARHFDLEEIYEEEKIVASAGPGLHKLKENKILKFLPWKEKDLEAGINKFVDFLKKRIGAEPVLVFTLQGKDKSRVWFCKPPFNNTLTKNETLNLLSKTYSYWISKTSGFDSGKNNKSNQSFFSLFTKWIGSFDSTQDKIYWLETLYSLKKKDVFYHLVLSFIDAENQPVNLNLFYLRNDFNRKFLLEKILVKNNKSAYKHSFGYSKLENLPQFYQDSKNLNFVFKLPHNFVENFKIGRQAVSIGIPVINIAFPLKKIQPGFFGKKQLNFAINFILFLSYAALIAFYTGRFSHKANLKKIISVAILFGTLVPFTGLVWLGISYLNGHKHQKAGELLNFINKKFDQTEKVLNLKRVRTEMLYHIMADRIERMSPEKRQQLIKQIAYYSDDYKKKKLQGFIKPFIGYFLINADSKEIIHTRSSYRKKFMQIKPFFMGTLNSLLIDMGMFDHLTTAQKRAVVQQTQLADGITEKAVDRKMFYDMLEFEGSRVVSELMPSRDYFYSFILNGNKISGDGLLTLITEDGNWLDHFVRAVNNKRILLSYKKFGFNIDLSFYPLDHFALKGLKKLPIKNSLMSYDQQDRLYKTAQAVYANSRNTFINNISQKPSQVVYSKVIAGQNIFALAYAREIKAENWPVHIFLVAVIGACLFVSVLCLAYSTAQILLMSLPAFITSIEKVDQQNFSWTIALNSGDEFEELSDSFNKMGRKLFEKEQMSQLVSEDVLQVIQDEKNLKTGGKKVYGSVLFSDLRGFTTLSEKYSAEEIVEMLNEYFTLMASIIERRGGVIDKLIGDAVQAVFYQSDSKEPCELRAVKAAREMQLRLRQFNRARAKNNKFEIANGFGIATGRVISGRVGTETGKLDATILGRVVYRAERLESLSKDGDTTGIMLDEATLKGLKKEKESVKFKTYDKESDKAFELIELL